MSHRILGYALAAAAILFAVAGSGRPPSAEPADQPAALAGLVVAKRL